MADSAGARLKAFRIALGVPRDRFCDLTGIENMRLITIENLKSRMSTDDLRLVVDVFPEILNWLVTGAPIDIEVLEKSENLHLQRLALSLKLEGKTALDGVEG